MVVSKAITEFAFILWLRCYECQRVIVVFYLVKQVWQAQGRIKRSIGVGNCILPSQVVVDYFDNTVEDRLLKFG